MIDLLITTTMIETRPHVREWFASRNQHGLTGRGPTETLAKARLRELERQCAFDNLYLVEE